MPEELTDKVGEIVWECSYQLCGKPIQEIAHTEIQQNLRYQGQYLDRETGLHYNTFRYYDPDIGRFTQPDPIGLLGGYNLYQYAPNPLMWVDPWGLESCYRTMKKDSKGNYIESPLDGAPNSMQKGARTKGSNPLHHDFKNILNSSDMVGPSYTGTNGLSGSTIPLPADPIRGTLNATTNLDKLPKGLNAINDHNTHISIYPARDMTFGEYQKLLNQIEWN